MQSVAPPEKYELYGLHKSFGLLVFMLAVGRVIWLKMSPRPDELDTHAHWEHVLAKITHLYLYAAIFLIPLSGYLMSSFGGYPVHFFGLSVPALVSKDKALFEITHEAHEILNSGILIALALHIAGAFKHHILDHDETLIRMAPGRSNIVYGAILILALGFFVTVGALLITEDEEDEDHDTPAAAISAPVEAQGQNPFPPLVDRLPKDKNGWSVLHDQSSLSFTITRINQPPITGNFHQYDADFVFDPEKLAGSWMHLTIDVGTLLTGDPTQDEDLRNDGFFTSDSYPAATFQTRVFEHVEGASYLVIGDLTLHGTTLPMSLPLKIDILPETDEKEGRRALINGKMDIDPQEFGIASDAGKALTLTLSFITHQPPQSLQ